MFVEQRHPGSTAGPSARWWPRLWLELHDSSDMPGHHLDGVLVAWAARAARSGSIRTEAVQRRRGRFSLGPGGRTSSGDPFGILLASVGVSSTDGTTVVVSPKKVPLPGFGRLPGELPGGALQGARVHFSTPNVSGRVRDYRPGDSFNRIHWPTTARTTRLTVREFELDPAADVWIVLDLRSPRRTTGSGAGEHRGVRRQRDVPVSRRHFLLDQGARWVWCRRWRRCRLTAGRGRRSAFWRCWRWCGRAAR